MGWKVRPLQNCLWQHVASAGISRELQIEVIRKIIFPNNLWDGAEFLTIIYKKSVYKIKNGRASLEIL
jgi:hypothetical protein